jgi:hypothetical protein
MTARSVQVKGNLGMLATMKELRSFFQKEIDISLPRVFLPKEELIPMEGYMFGSLYAKEHPYLAQGDITDFISSEDKGYFLIGYWGHGANSYAFYYLRIDEWSHIFFRLPYGGFYSNIEENKTLIRKFLMNYFKFEPELKRQAKSVIAIDSMGYGDYKIELSDGRMVCLEESLFHNPDFIGKFNHLLIA